MHVMLSYGISAPNIVLILPQNFIHIQFGLRSCQFTRTRNFLNGHIFSPLLLQAFYNQSKNFLGNIDKNHVYPD